MPRGQRLLQGTWIGDLIDLIPPPILAGIAVYRIAMTIPAPKWVDAKRKEFQRDMGQYRKVAFFHCCPTIFMLVVWLLVVYNYYAIVRWSDASWPVGVMVTGYGLIALQVASFDRVMRTHPGVLPEEWRVEAHRGHAPFYICRRTGRKLPPRCFHIKSLGQVPRVCAAQPTPPRSSPPPHPRERSAVRGGARASFPCRSVASPFLASPRVAAALPPRRLRRPARWPRRSQDVLFLDHFCFWLNKPIGLRNRKCHDTSETFLLPPPPSPPTTASTAASPRRPSSTLPPPHLPSTPPASTVLVPPPTSARPRHALWTRPLTRPRRLPPRRYFLLFLGYSLLLTVLGVLLVASLLHGVYFNPHTTLRMLLPFAPVTHPSARPPASALDPPPPLPARTARPSLTAPLPPPPPVPP